MMNPSFPSESANHEQLTPSSPRLPWYAIRVRSNFEQTTAFHLRDRGFEEFCPSYQSERQWSDRKKIIEKSLFPGYVFCRLDPQQRLHVITTPGVVNLVGFGKEPCPIPDQEIERVRTMIQSGSLVMPWPSLAEGQTVLIERGPLAGLEGHLQVLKGKSRILVSVTLLQRSVSAEIDRSWVTPVNPPHKKVTSITGSTLSKAI